MIARCPYLRLKDKRDQVLLDPSLDQRCYVRYRPERVGVVQQAVTCLTPDHRRCPRHSFAVRPGDTLADRVSLPQPVTSGPPARRRMTGTEVTVVGMAVAVLVAFIFVGFAMLYRLSVGPGMLAAPSVAGGPASAPTQITPTSAPNPTDTTPLPSLVPTLTMVPVNSPAPVSEPAAPAHSPVSISELAVPEPTPYVRVPADSPPTRLVISKIGLDIPVLTVGVKTIGDGAKSKAVWADVPDAGGFHQTSAYPGNIGNTVVNGHRDVLGSVFRHLDRVEMGDSIFLYVDQTAYPYTVVEILVVPEAFASAEQRAENLRLIGYMPEERLTLVTCTPVGLATHRLLVIARPPDQPLPQMPEAGTDPSQ